MTSKEKVQYRGRTIFREQGRLIIVRNGNPVKRKFQSLQEATDFIDKRVRVQ